ncbi:MULTISPECIES: hypothetical protein [unclassified Micromonospora]|uniref:hypothetical protein n=1 Tax=unclassified Micromonospora TaxID=2617518 RepID=UPI003A8B02F0
MRGHPASRRGTSVSLDAHIDLVGTAMLPRAGIPPLARPVGSGTRLALTLDLV